MSQQLVSMSSIPPISTKQGYLFKRGQLNTSYKARWCKVEDTKLLYFKTSDNPKPINFIPLEQAVVRVIFPIFFMFT